MDKREKASGPYARPKAPRSRRFPFSENARSFGIHVGRRETTTMTTQRNLAHVFAFLSTLLSDEPNRTLLERLAAPVFLKSWEAAARGCGGDLAAAGTQFSKALAADPAPQARTLAYEYADLFLNAGVAPVFPYASCQTNGLPIVQQKPLFELRAAYRRADVRRTSAFKDLDEHIALVLEFEALLLSRNDAEAWTFHEAQAPWLETFCDNLESAAREPFYQGLAALLRAVVREPRKADLLGEACAQAGFAYSPTLLIPGARPETPPKTLATHCYTCGALCGMTATVTDGVLTGVKGLPGDPKGAGKLCPKGGSAPKHLHSAYRLKRPLIREGVRFRQAGWDEALALVTSKLRAMEQGKMAYMRGNDFCNWIHEALFDHLGCPKGSHRTMCDNANRMWNEHALNDKRPWINYEESDYILHFGMNELASSYGQRKTAALKAALKRGAKLVVADPRKSETAAKADEWLAIRPGTDGALAMAMAQVIISEDLYDKNFVERWTSGFAEFSARVLGGEDGTPRTPEWAESICGIPAETIRRVAREFATAKNKGALSWTGLAQTPNGFWNTAAIQALNGLCGCFDNPGGPSLPFKRKLGSPWGEGQTKPPKTDTPKLDSFSMWSGWAPSVFERDVDAGKIKGLICYWGDPALSWGNAASVRRGLDKLEFVCVIDAYMCNSALQADVVLPDATWLEQAQVKPDWLYEAFLSWFAEVVEPMYDSRPIWRISMDLAQLLGLSEFFPWDDPEEGFRNQLAGTPWNFDELKKKGFLLTDEARYRKYEDWGGLNPPEGYGSSGTTRTGKYNFVNPVAMDKGLDALPDHKSVDKDLTPDDDYPFVLVNYRLFQHEHCSTFNNYQLMKLRPTNPLVINADDAKRLGVADGDTVLVSSPWGEVEMKVSPTEDIRPGVLAAAGGYGHLRGLEGDPAYPQFGGVNAAGELMKPDTPEAVGGSPLLKYIKTRVRRVA